MVVPDTVRLPVTVRLSDTVTSDVLCPKVMAVPDTPVPIDTDSLEFAVSIIRYASDPCFIVRAVAELSDTATFSATVVAQKSVQAVSYTHLTLPTKRIV